jgi:transposase
MLDPNKRQSIVLLHREGMSLRELARRLRVGRNTIRAILRRPEARAPAPRRERVPLSEELLRTLFAECQGRAQRVWEKLAEEHGLPVPYATLTRRLRRLHLRAPRTPRCARVPDEPGAEMQHDTTVYRLRLGGTEARVVASLLYLRYSKRRYLKFYRAFNRFRMKCFFHEALAFWGYAARECIIDNTNLARLRGVGAQAEMAPEMAAFARAMGFTFRCHELGHSNRKAGEERSFYTVETNFLPGRVFGDWEDLNRQAFEWATARMERRPVGKGRLIPCQAFEHERAFLTPVPAGLSPPYLELPRLVDQYGYVACEGNYYWVPGDGREPVKVLQYATRLEIYSQGQLLAQYPLPPETARNRIFTPPGQGRLPHRPKSLKHPTQQEEQRLRAMGEEVQAYLEFALRPKGIARHQTVRALFSLAQQTGPEIFRKVLARALRFSITDTATLRRMALLLLGAAGPRAILAEIDEGFQDRESYREGRVTDLPDLSRYDRLLQNPEDPEPAHGG